MLEFLVQKLWGEVIIGVGVGSAIYLAIKTSVDDPDGYLNILKEIPNGCMGMKIIQYLLPL